MNPLNTVFIADDHLVFLEDLKTLIDRNARLQLVGAATDGDSTWERISVLKPTIALLDVSMPGLSGLEIADRIRKRDLAVKVIIITSFKEESLFNRAMNLGVCGFVLKDDCALDLPRALRSVSEGGTFLSPDIEPFQLRREQEHERAARKPGGLDDFTPQELRLLRLLTEDLRDKEICKQLKLSIKDVLALRKRIGAKLGLTHERELLAYALGHRTELEGFKLISHDFK